MNCRWWSVTGKLKRWAFTTDGFVRSFTGRVRFLSRVPFVESVPCPVKCLVSFVPRSQQLTLWVDTIITDRNEGQNSKNKTWGSVDGFISEHIGTRICISSFCLFVFPSLIISVSSLFHFWMHLKLLSRSSQTGSAHFYRYHFWPKSCIEAPQNFISFGILIFPLSLILVLLALEELLSPCSCKALMLVSELVSSQTLEDVIVLGVFGSPSFVKFISVYTAPNPFCPRRNKVQFHPYMCVSEPPLNWNLTFGVWSVVVSFSSILSQRTTSPDFLCETFLLHTTCHIRPFPHTHTHDTGQFGVRYLARGHFGMRAGGAPTDRRAMRDQFHPQSRAAGLCCSAPERLRHRAFRVVKFVAVMSFEQTTVTVRVLVL